MALKHYVRSTDVDFERASSPVLNSGPDSGHEVAGTDENQDEPAKNLVTQASQATPEELNKPNKTLAFGDNSEARQVVPTGLEPVTFRM